MVCTAAVPTEKPIEAKEEPCSSLKTKVPEAKTCEHSDSKKVVCEAASEASEGDPGIANTTSSTRPTDSGSSEIKSEVGLALSRGLENGEEATDHHSRVDSMGNVSVSVAGNRNEELAAPAAGEPPSERLYCKGRLESTGEQGEDLLSSSSSSAAAGEALPLDSTAAPGAEMSGGVSQSSTKPIASETRRGDASEMPGAEVWVALGEEAENPSAATQAGMAVQGEKVGGDIREGTERRSSDPKMVVAAEAVAEKLPEGLVFSEGDTQDKKCKTEAKEGSPEQSSSKAQPAQAVGQAQVEGAANNASIISAAEPAPSLEATSVSKTILKALMSVPNIAKSRTVTRKEEQKSASKPATRSRAAAEKNIAPEEANSQKPTNSPSSLPDGSKSKPRLSSVIVKVGSEKRSSQQDAEPQVEAKGSSKPRERESRSSSLKRDSSSNKVRAKAPARYEWLVAKVDTSSRPRNKCKHNYAHPPSPVPVPPLL